MFDMQSVLIMLCFICRVAMTDHRRHHDGGAFRRLQGGCKGLQGVTRVIRGHKGLQGVTRGCKGSVRGCNQREHQLNSADQYYEFADILSKSITLYLL